MQIIISFQQEQDPTTTHVRLATSQDQSLRNIQQLLEELLVILATTKKA
jgi:hypothetical protein